MYCAIVCFDNALTVVLYIDISYLITNTPTFSTHLAVQANQKCAAQFVCFATKGVAWVILIALGGAQLQLTSLI